MDIFQIFAILITLTAVFAYFNYKVIKLPTTIGLMLISFILSLGLILLGNIWSGLKDPATALIANIDFNETLMRGMLSYLLFAGALHVNLNDLRDQKFIVGFLATVGVLISTFLFGTAAYYIFQIIGIQINYIYCLVFGALVSPTDPIAVMGILKRINVPKSLETKIAGESLFNDGIGVVIFIVLFEIAFGGHEVSAGHVIELFALEAVGGAAFGLATGYIAYRMLKTVDNYSVEAMITLALVTGSYALAMTLHLSGPIAVVVSGLLIGNRGRSFAMSDKTRENLDTFWELIDEILNAVLFVLIGMEVLVLSFGWDYILAGLIAIPTLLLTRAFAVSLANLVLKWRREFSKGMIRILVWGGLRGGISVALALSLPQSEERAVILTATYIIVAFSILVQGFTIKKLVKSIYGD